MLVSKESNYDMVSWAVSGSRGTATLGIDLREKTGTITLIFDKSDEKRTIVASDVDKIQCQVDDVGKTVDQMRIEKGKIGVSCQDGILNISIHNLR